MTTIFLHGFLWWPFSVSRRLRRGPSYVAWHFTAQILRHAQAMGAHTW